MGYGMLAMSFREETALSAGARDASGNVKRRQGGTE